MKMPVALLDCLVDARREVENHPLYHLEPYWRFAVYSTLNAAFALTLSEERRGESAMGVLPAYHLSTIATRHVLPLWEEIWPDDVPHRLLALAEEELFNDYMSVETREFLRQSEDILIELSTDEEEGVQNRVCVGIAAMVTAWLAVTHEDDFVNSFASKPEDEYWGEGAFDFYDSDAAVWAVRACAGGDWSPNFNRQKSREFWLWWLDEAVPETWRFLTRPA